MEHVLNQLRFIFGHTDLIRFLVKSDFKEKHNNLILGYLWWMLDPLLWMLVYLFLVQIVFQIHEPNYPLFIFSALLPWRAFSLSVIKSMNSIKTKKNIIKQVAIPKAIFPVIAVINETLMLIPGMLILISIGLFVGIAPTLNLLFLPFIILIQMTLALSFGLFFSIILMYFPDLQNLMAFTLRIWFYISPALYAASRIPEQYQMIYNLNPFVFIFESYRNVLFYGRPPDVIQLFIYLFAISVLLLTSLYFFSHKEQHIAKAF